jgi:hypothetical protein
LSLKLNKCQLVTLEKEWLEKFTTKEETECVEDEFQILMKTFGEFKEECGKDIEAYNDRLEDIVASNIDI